MDTYAIALVLFMIASLALIGLFLWQLFSGKLRPQGNFGRGFEPVFPLDRTDIAREKADVAGAGTLPARSRVPEGSAGGGKR